MPEPTEILEFIAPEFDNASGRATALELAETQTGKVFGKDRDHAVALLAAHMLTLRNRRGVGGAVNNVSEGDISRGFTANATRNLETTSHGQELQRLRDQNIIGARTRHV